jgi:hypothetical protein
LLRPLRYDRKQRVKASRRALAQALTVTDAGKIERRQQRHALLKHSCVHEVGERALA